MTDLCHEMEQLGKAMSNANRARILEALLTGSKTVNDVVKEVKLSQPLVSQNLKVLKSANLVTDERRGQEVQYTVNVRHMADILKRLSSSVRQCPKFTNK